jgi:hypothetical protein
LFTLVDADDAPAVAGWTWHALPRRRGRGWYAVRWERQAGRQQTIYLHRQLLDAPDGHQVDHINGDTLDNRRVDLRLCTASQNAVNKPASSPTTGFRGVYLERGRYRAQIAVQGRRRSLGQFATPEGAAAAYDRAAADTFGPFARLNLPWGTAMTVHTDRPRRELWRQELPCRPFHLAKRRSCRMSRISSTAHRAAPPKQCICCTACQSGAADALAVG